MAHQIQQLSKLWDQFLPPDLDCSFTRLYPAGQLLHSFGKITSGATFERTLPDRGHAPASIGQDSDGVLIICDVAADLLAPEVLPCRRPFEQMAVVPMPEAAIHKDDGPVTRKNQIGFSGQILYMQPIARPGSM